jgi:hypothetical protein
LSAQNQALRLSTVSSAPLNETLVIRCTRRLQYTLKSLYPDPLDLQVKVTKLSNPDFDDTSLVERWGRPMTKTPPMLGQPTTLKGRKPRHQRFCKVTFFLWEFTWEFMSLRAPPCENFQKLKKFNFAQNLFLDLFYGKHTQSSPKMLRCRFLYESSLTVSWPSLVSPGGRDKVTSVYTGGDAYT